MFCLKCGNQIPDGSVFCPSCGAQQTQQGQTGSRISFERPSGYKQNRRNNIPDQTNNMQPYQDNTQQPYTDNTQQSYQNNIQQPYQDNTQQSYQTNMQQPYQNNVQQPYQTNMQQPYQNNMQQPYQNNMQQPYQNNVQQPYQNGMQQPYQTGGQMPFQTPVQSGNIQSPYSGGVVRPKKGKGFAVLLLLVLIGGGALFAFKKPAGGGNNNGNSAAADEYNELCEMAAHGTESYIYARMITEQLLQTDTSVADPDEVNSLFDECLTAWQEVGKLSDNISEKSEKLSGKLTDMQTDGKEAKKSLFGMWVSADMYVPDHISDVQTAEESLGSCSRLSSHFSSDSSSAYSQISELRTVYSGRDTSSLEWQRSVQSVSGSFSSEIYISGEITSTEFTTGRTQSVHTLSREVKTGTIAVSGATTLVNVGQNGSTIVVGRNDSGIVADRSEIGNSIDGTGSTISISTESSSETSRIVFHRESLSGWFILNKVGGYRLTRHEKGSAVTHTEVETTIIDIGEGGHTIEESGLPRGLIPESSRSGPRDWSVGVRNTGDINTSNNNENGNRGGGTNTPSEENMRRTSEEVHPGSGAITVRMNWGTDDDLDLHMNTPDGSHIYYSRKEAGGGILDVDMNAREIVADPIENIYFPHPEAGHYKVWINDYRDRTPGTATRYIVSVTIDGEETIYEGSIDSQGTDIVIVEFDYHGSGNNGEGENTVTGNGLTERLNSLNAGEGPITVSMIWGTQDDLDLHVITPDDSHVYYSCKQAGGGVLDIDANSSGHMMDNPIENIYFAAPQSGHYKVYIHDFSDRTPDSTTHYLVRVKVGDNVQEFEGDIDNGAEVVIIEFDYGGGSNGRIPAGSKTLGDHSYYFYDQSMTWTQAKKFCESLGGHLATITSAEEQAFIESSFPGSTAWLGGFEGSNEVWYWITGEPMTYTNWYGTTPDDYNNTEEWCMQLHIDMKWNDLPDDDTYWHVGFICEWDGLPNMISESEIEQILNGAGAATGPVTISLGWSTNDDLDLHVFTPNNNEIYFNNRTADGGELDVDMIPSNGDTPPCAENIYFAEPMNGEYYVYVYNYDDCTPDSQTNYMVRVKIGDETKTFEGTIDGTDNYIEVCGFRYNGQVSSGGSSNSGSSSDSNSAAAVNAAPVAVVQGPITLDYCRYESSDRRVHFCLTYDYTTLFDNYMPYVMLVPVGTADDAVSAYDAADDPLSVYHVLSTGNDHFLPLNPFSESDNGKEFELRVYSSREADGICWAMGKITVS